MSSQIEIDLAKALDLLNATQIVALYLGLFNLRTQILADPHPRKNNAAGRAYTAETFRRLLANELQNGLAKRDPGKARDVAEEMLLHKDHTLHQMGFSLREVLPPRRGER
jgi:hypothetical protein